MPVEKSMILYAPEPHSVAPPLFVDDRAPVSASPLVNSTSIHAINRCTLLSPP